MAFLPVVDIIKIPRDSKSFYFNDATPDAPGNPTGWGGDDGPASADDITTMCAEIQPLGEEPILVTDVTGDLSGTVRFVVDIPDGVNNIYVHYGQNVNTAGGFTVADDRLSITFLSLTAQQVTDLFAGVTKANVNSDFPVRVTSVDDTTVTFAEPLSGTIAAYYGIFIYYTASDQVLVLNAAEALNVNDIAGLMQQNNKCEKGLEIFQNIMLQFAAVRAFLCCNPARAHQAARRLTGNVPFVSTENCSDCGN